MCQNVENVNNGSAEELPIFGHLVLIRLPQHHPTCILVY